MGLMLWYGIIGNNNKALQVFTKVGLDRSELDHATLVSQERSTDMWKPSIWVGNGLAIAVTSPLSTKFKC